MSLTADPTEPVGLVSPTADTERALAEVLADIVHVDRVSVDQHFFDDLGADSMMMAQFCARVRKRADLPSLSMKDIYRHPTIAGLAATVAPVPEQGQEQEQPPVTPAAPDRAPAPGDQEARAPAAPAPTPPPEPHALRRASTTQYVLCAALQFLAYLGSACAAAATAMAGYRWITDATGATGTYLRLVVFGGATFSGVCLLPVVAKWVLVGRWKPQQIPVWSVAYVRFWLVKSLIRANPLVPLMIGSPLYSLYLRALGAEVGKGVVIFSRYVPVCTDLLTIGAGTVIRRDAIFSCYRAHAGVIETGTVRFGRDVVVGDASVIDIDASMGDGTQLGHASSLHSGQHVPDGERWHGSPAQRTEVDHRLVEGADCGTARRATYAVGQLLTVLLLYLPFTVGVQDVLLGAVVQPTAGPSSGVAVMQWRFYVDALAASFVLYFGALLVGLAVVVTVPRLLNRGIQPDTVYPLFGFHYRLQRMIARISNAKVFTTLFGDSSAIVHYLQWIGYRLAPVQQTGSNFGTFVKHENPFLCSVGTGTVVADGLSLANADYSSTSFRVSRASIGRHNFVGNGVVYPAQGRTGDNCLLATKVMVPIDGDVREGVGLLGSPSFEIPRSVQRDSRFDHLAVGDELRRRLAAKNRYNAVTIGLHLLVRWIHLFGIVVVASAAADLYPSLGALILGLGAVATLLFSVAYWVAVERAVARHPMTPQFCSIYEPYFWWHERYWKVPGIATVLPLFNGTPFKSVIWRLIGVRVGRRLFDDGCFMPEKSLVTIGDDVTLNAGSVLQCHSQEDGTFKSDRTRVGSGCTLAVGAFVHYGVTVGDGAVLAPDSFLMKGEEVPPGARWGGNPARDMGDRSTELTSTGGGQIR